jgi:hypothetical protein
VVLEKKKIFKEKMKRLIPLFLIVAAIVGIAIYMSSQRDVSKTTGDQADFAISDTSAIGKIIIADRLGNVIKLERKSGNYWELNEKYRARPDAVDVLMKTFRNIYVQRPVAKEAQEQVNRVMAGGSKKVEIYDQSGELTKIWYVGHATMDKKGTYMLLETPKMGKSPSAFIMDMKGFIGMLNTRFFTNENEWRSVVLLEYPQMNLEEIEVIYPSAPDSSFRITYDGGNAISLFSYPEQERIARFDTNLVKDYMLNFKLVSFENYRTGLSESQEDSVMASVPYQIIRIKDESNRHEIRLWPKKAPENQMNEAGDAAAIIDRERIYAASQSGELALAQRYVWDKFRAPLQAFAP